MFYYSVFDLLICSDFYIPQWKALDTGSNMALPAVKISLGQVSEDGIANPKGQRLLWQVDEGFVWLKIPGIARFLVAEGCRITIEPYPDSNPKTWMIYLMGSAFGALLLQRKQLLMHATSLSKGSQGYLITGRSGAGKSTTSAALSHHGYRLCADDQTLIRKDFSLVSGHPFVKLWGESIDMIDANAGSAIKVRPGELNRIRDEQEKYYLPVPSQNMNSQIKTAEEARENESATVRSVFILDFAAIKTPDFFEVRDSEKVESILGNIYRKMYIPGMGLEGYFTHRAVQLSAKINCYKVLRPIHENSLNAVIQLLIELMEKDQRA